MSFEADPSGWFDGADNSFVLARTSYNVAAGGVNLASAGALALFCAPFNANVKLGVEVVLVVANAAGIAFYGGEGILGVSSTDSTSNSFDFDPFGNFGGVTGRRLVSLKSNYENWILKNNKKNAIASWL